METKETKTRVKGHIVSHDSSVNAGLRYLMYLIEEKEARVFFDQAYNHGFAFFEDQMGKNYKLIHRGSEYQLVKA